MDYADYLRQLNIDVPRPGDRPHAHDSVLDAKTRALVGLGALIAIGAAEATIHREIDDAIAAGAQSPEIVAVLDVVLPLAGRACVVKASSKVALALGIDLEL
ncbi:UNVERIFIED_CONTAM: carboxymuconolactone decarboxylase family protein [Microbacterium sp. SLM126]